jgi:uncharacterized delta-60 repeat protein
MKKLVTLSALLFAACGDDAKSTPDAGTMADSGDTDAPVDTPAWVKPTAVSLALSATGPDQLMSVVPGPSGSFYAAGYAATGAAGAKYLLVAKLTAAGALDTTFASPNGFYTSTVEFMGGTDEIDLVVQSTGKIVVAATIANDTDPDDRDIGVFRVNADGTPDGTFGPTDTGFVRLNLSTAFDDAGTPKSTDSERSIGVGPNDALFIHAASRDDVDMAGAREDTDFTVAKLSEDGVLDTSYAGGDGKYLLDLQETNDVATAKALVVLGDGSVIASGYARTDATKLQPGDADGTPQPVLYRLDPDGVPVTGFAGTDGVFHESVLSLQTEIYAFALDGDKITTAGYGRDTGTNNVWATLRFDADDGTRSTSFAAATGGVKTLDPSGTVAGANCRNAIGLPGGKTALIGSTGGSGARDAALAVLTMNGQVAPEYPSGDATGVIKWDLGTGEDQWWGGAVNSGVLLVAGWKGYAAGSQTDSANDDAQVIVLELQ